MYYVVPIISYYYNGSFSGQTGQYLGLFHISLVYIVPVFYFYIPLFKWFTFPHTYVLLFYFFYIFVVHFAAVTLNFPVVRLIKEYLIS